MSIELTKELCAAIDATGNRPLELVDPSTHRSYFLVDRQIHLQAMEALRREQDRESIAVGLRQMQAGLGKPLEQAFSDIRSRLNFAANP